MTTLQSVERRARLFLAELCSTHTPAGAERRLLPLLERELARLGASAQIQALPDGRVNVLAVWGEPRVVYSTHLDVVDPALPVAVDDSGIAARGACDAKGQIAAQFAAIEILLAEGGGNLAWLGVSGEETDSAGARAALALAPRFRSCRAVIAGEPTRCRVARGQKGYLRLRLSCRGRSAHGGSPELGDNAVEKLMDWLVAIRAAPRAEHPRLGREVLNIGAISGGVAANVVPDFAGAEISIRTVPGGVLPATVESARPQGALVETLIDETWDEFDAPEGFESAPVSFGSDLPALRALAPGAFAILAGPGDIALAHSEAERLDWGELARGIELFRALGERYLLDGKSPVLPDKSKRRPAGIR
ncbi:MAG: M20/M25/M40 family metallo-hydrolase [Spirochaetales bacterium]|nr:M20/M25/M40 family metallo-hydrolase [Spirochaetales bacterium]